MKKIKILHWDDDPGERTDVEVVLRRNFKKEDYDYQFRNSNIKELIVQIIEREEHFDLLILDLFDQERHLVADELLKQLQPAHKVIVLTQSADCSVKNALRDPLIKVNFDLVFKAQLTDEFLTPLIEKKTGLKRKQESILELVWEKNDIFTNYQISIVTEEHLVNLLTAYLNYKKKNYHDIKPNVLINPIVSGFSGALVFRVEFFFESTDSINILLKVDKIKLNLINELKLAKGSRYQQINLDYRIEYDDIILASEKDDSCWYALTSSFILEGETLKHRILRDGDFDKIEELIITLFNKCLSNVYLKNVKKIRPDTLVYPVKEIMNIITNRKKAFISNAGKELFKLFELSEEDTEKKIRAIFSFPDGKKALSSFENNGYKKIILSHGDMHGNNIMVSKDGQIKIIDPANIEHDHWARDLCMLIVDLFAYGIDYGDKEYFGISRIEDWRTMGSCLFEGTKIKNGVKNKAVCKILSNLTDESYIKSILGFDEWYEDWEFQLSLVIEFLRISYKSNQLPAGKRAACMLIAFDGFEKAQKSYRTFIES